MKRFHGRIQLESDRISPQAGKIANEVINHLIQNISNQVDVTLEIQADLPDGASEHLIRTITENCKTLKFEQYGFEEE